MGEIKFEKAIQRLEKIVDDLEKGEMDIDKSLEIFEEVKLNNPETIGQVSFIESMGEKPSKYKKFDS